MNAHDGWAHLTRRMVMRGFAASAFAARVAVQPSHAAARWPLGASDAVVRRDIVYREIDGETLSLDAYVPSDFRGDRAAVVHIHGGGWHKGDKGVSQSQTLCNDLAAEGFVAISVNYRLAPDFTFPAQIEDVEAAVRWLREPAQTASLGIDPMRIGTVGTSAGGNLAGLLGTRGSGSWTEGSRVAAVVSLSGPMVLTTDAMSFPDPDEGDLGIVFDYLGCSDTDQCPEASDASPVDQVDATDPPFLLINSEDERRVVREQAEMMGEALSEAGVENEVIIWPGDAHAMALWKDEEVRDDVMTFLHAHLDRSSAAPVA